jgi:uncharacterized protein
MCYDCWPLMALYHENHIRNVGRYEAEDCGLFTSADIRHPEVINYQKTSIKKIAADRICKTGRESTGNLYPGKCLVKLFQFLSVSKTKEELSIVCDQSIVPADVRKVENWHAFKVEGPLNFPQTGIISSLTKPLAENKIPIFVISTYDTDYLLVESKYFTLAKEVLIKICSIKE